MLRPDAGPRNPVPNSYTGADGIPHSLSKADAGTYRSGNHVTGHSSQPRIDTNFGDNSRPDKRPDSDTYGTRQDPWGSVQCQW